MSNVQPYNLTGICTADVTVTDKSYPRNAADDRFPCHIHTTANGNLCLLMRNWPCCSGIGAVFRINTPKFQPRRHVSVAPRTAAQGHGVSQVTSFLFWGSAPNRYPANHHHLMRAVFIATSDVLLGPAIIISGNHSRLWPALPCLDQTLVSAFVCFCRYYPSHILFRLLRHEAAIGGSVRDSGSSPVPHGCFPFVALGVMYREWRRAKTMANRSPVN